MCIFVNQSLKDVARGRRQRLGQAVGWDPGAQGKTAASTRRIVANEDRLNRRAARTEIGHGSSRRRWKARLVEITPSGDGAGLRG
jgi:hypothetical protein